MTTDYRLQMRKLRSITGGLKGKTGPERRVEKLSQEPKPTADTGMN